MSFRILFLWELPEFSIPTLKHLYSEKKFNVLKQFILNHPKKSKEAIK